MTFYQAIFNGDSGMVHYDEADAIADLEAAGFDISQLTRHSSGILHGHDGNIDACIAIIKV